MLNNTHIYDLWKASKKYAPSKIPVRNSGSCRVEKSPPMFPKVMLKGVVVYSDKEKYLIWENIWLTTIVIWELLGKSDLAPPPWTNLMLLLMFPKIQMHIHALNCIEPRLSLLAGRRAELLSVQNFSKLMLQAIFSAHLTYSCFIVDSSTTLTVRIKTK